MCRSAGVPLIVDAAQAFAHLDCAGIGADVVYSTSRKWTAGPRGVGWLAIRPGWPSDFCCGCPPHGTCRHGASLAHGEVNVAARSAFRWRSVSTSPPGRSASAPGSPRSGRRPAPRWPTSPGWRVIEPVDEPSAITTLEPPDGVDPAQVRAWLIEEHRIVTTYRVSNGRRTR